QVGEGGLVAILRRQGVGIRDGRPVDGDVRIVPGDALVMFGAIIIAHSVADDRVGLERTKSMPEAGRDPKLVILPWTELRRDPSPVGCGIAAQIHRNVEQPSSKAADELVLGGGVGLKMNAPDRSGAAAERLIVLDELNCRSVPCEFVKPEDLREIATLVADLPRLDFDRSVEPKSTKFHCRPLMFHNVRQAYRSLEGVQAAQQASRVARAGPRRSSRSPPSMAPASTSAGSQRAL